MLGKVLEHSEGRFFRENSRRKSSEGKRLSDNMAAKCRSVVTGGLAKRCFIIYMGIYALGEEDVCILASILVAD